MTVFTYAPFFISSAWESWRSEDLLVDELRFHKRWRVSLQSEKNPSVERLLISGRTSPFVLCHGGIRNVKTRRGDERRILRWPDNRAFSLQASSRPYSQDRSWLDNVTASLALNKIFGGAQRTKGTLCTCQRKKSCVKTWLFSYQ